jgi:non-ribosomal peptide synthetase component E (peptide arylation enzyme)
MDYFEKQADVTPDRATIVEGDRCYSYAERYRQSQPIARAVQLQFAGLTD